MSGSVAGKIRIDFLTNVARFKAECRQAAREGLGGFSEEARRINLRRPAGNALAASIKAESDAWKAAMGSIRQERKSLGIGNRMDPLAFGALGNLNARSDMATQRRIRLAGLLPWGMTLRSEMSAESIKTALEAERSTARVAGALARSRGEFGRAAGMAAGAAGLGGLSRLGRFATNPYTLAAGAAAAAVASAAMEQKRRAGLAREAGAFSELTGIGVGESSRLRAVGFDQQAAAKFFRALQTGKGFSGLGLNAEALRGKPITSALADVADAFVKMPDTAGRANAAMELFGRGGYELLPLLRNLREKLADVAAADVVSPERVERTKAYDRAQKGISDAYHTATGNLGKMMGMDAGVGTGIMRYIEGIGAYYGAGDMGRITDRWAREDYKIRNADALEKKRIAQEQAAARQAEYDRSLRQRDAMLQERGTSIAASRQGIVDSLAPAKSEWQERAKAIDDLYRTELAHNTELLNAGKLGIYDYREANIAAERDAHSLRMQNLADYNQARAEQEQRRKDAIARQDRARASAVTESLLNPAEAQALAEYRNWDLVQKGKLSARDWTEWQARGRKETWQGYLDRAAAQVPEYSPVAAKTLGSSGAYSSIARELSSAGRQNEIERIARQQFELDKQEAQKRATIVQLLKDEKTVTF